MPRCPNCKKVRNLLKISHIKATDYYVWVEDTSEGNKLSYDKFQTRNLLDKDIFVCPFCETVIATSEKEAIEYLKS